MWHLANSLLHDHLFLICAILNLFHPSVHAQTWCNKNYMQSQPIVPPFGAFPVPKISPVPLLAFRCAPSFKPYLAEDASQPGGILVDAFITSSKIYNTAPIVLSEFAETLKLFFSADGQELGQMVIPLNVTKIEFQFPLTKLSPRREPYTIDCAATYTDPDSITEQTFHAKTSIAFLPNPTVGSITKMDHRTGALLAKSVNKEDYDIVFPVGFYTSFGGYLDSDLSLLDTIMAQGFNMVHPVPPFGDKDAFEAVLNRMEELGLYLMYDMRHSYNFPDRIADEVKMIQNRSNLLLWYTADEPDGPGDPPLAAVTAYDLIQSMDGYHPVSLALNCADYEFAAYASGADIIMPDTYMIGTDVNFSAKYNTSCTPEFGCCGCDNCQGNLEDVSGRLDDFRSRLQVLGWDKSKILWSVTQAFGGEEFWIRPPTGKEWLVQAILSINHGALGIIPWIDPTPPDIKEAASMFANCMQFVKEFLFNVDAVMVHHTSERIDTSRWTVGARTLIFVTNMNDNDAKLELPDARGMVLQWLLQEGAQVSHSEEHSDVVMEAFGSGIFILTEAVHRHDHDL